MAKNGEQKENSFNFTNLREAAEYKLKVSPEIPEEIKIIPVDELVEELRIHQVELEMQNEELKKNQILLEESRDKYVDLYDFAPVGYFVFNNLGFIEKVNLSGAFFLGIERHKLLNKSFRQFVYPDNRDIWDRHIFNVLKYDEKQSCDLLLVKKDGYSIYVRLESIRLHSNDEKDKMRTAMSDITERKRAEEKLKESHRQLEETLVKLKDTQKQVLQQEKLRSLGHMTSGISHDINNSLMPIMGCVDMLRDDKELMDRHEKKLNMIIQSAKNIATTIGRLKDFYKIKLSDKDLPEKEINKIINSAIELTRIRWNNIAEATGSGIVIKKELEEDLPLAKVDESEITEALTNVIINACDAMIGGGTLTFRTYQKDDDIVIEIEDTGMGMDEEILQHCLDPFFTTKGDRGAGLGLSIVFGAIDRHRGEIKIESKRHKGTTIKLIIPVDLKIKEEKQIDEIVKLMKPLKILCVENDEDIRENLEQMLLRRGNKVEVAPSGKSSLKLYKEALEKSEPFDLVITDLGMFEMDGITLSKELKKLTPDIPIILLTGWGTLINQDDYQIIDYVIKKPIKQEGLFRAISGLFKDK